MLSLLRIFPLLAIAAFLLACGNGTGEKQEDDATRKDTLSSLAEVSQQLKALNAAIEENPADASRYAQRAELLRRMNEPQQAIRDLTQAVRLDSANHHYVRRLGDIFFEQQQYSYAARCYRQGLTLAVEKLPFHLRLARTLLYLREHETGINHANEVLRKDIHHAEAYFIKGMHYKYLGDTSKAISTFQTATEQDPEHIESYMQIGLLMSRQNHELAVHYLDNVLHLDSMHKEALYAKGMYYQQQEQYREAIETYRTLIRRHPDHEPAFYNIGYIYFIQDSIPKALRHFEMALKVSPYYPKAYYMRGLCYETLGEVAKARRDYRQALKLEEDFELAQRGLERLRQIN